MFEEATAGGDFEKMQKNSVPCAGNAGYRYHTGRVVSNGSM